MNSQFYFRRIMKKFFFLIAIATISISVGLAQGCLPEGITFTTQEQIDSFHVNYPECTEIEGDVYIGSSGINFNIMNLNGLNVITKIYGRLDISGCHGIGDLSGLNSLTQVGNYLKINDCADLDNFSGLDSLLNIGKGLVISSNEMLTGLQALASLTHIGGELCIANNESLTSLEGLHHLISIDSSIKLSQNPNLADISALENIEPDSIQTYLAIMNNSDLSECAIQSICEYLASPTGLIFINNNGSGCNSPAQVQQACVTSEGEYPADEKITLSPNPATSFITLTVPGDLPIEEAIIYNHFGQKVVSTKPVNNTVDISGLKAGMYWIEVATKEWREKTKFIKQ